MPQRALEFAVSASTRSMLLLLILVRNISRERLMMRSLLFLGCHLLDRPIFGMVLMAREPSRFGRGFTLNRRGRLVRSSRMERMSQGSLDVAGCPTFCLVVMLRILLLKISRARLTMRSLLFWGSRLFGVPRSVVMSGQLLRSLLGP